MKSCDLGSTATLYSEPLRGAGRAVSWANILSTLSGDCNNRTGKVPVLLTDDHYMSGQVVRRCVKSCRPRFLLFSADFRRAR
jgi:hypothetical protein